MKIKVRVKPNAGRNEVKKIGESYYEVRVSVPPEKGKANERMIELMSRALRVPKRAVVITNGRTSKEKIIEIN